jgi:rubrerythrin
MSCTSSDEKVKDTNSTANKSSTEQKSSDFSGKLKLVIAGETFEYDSMTKSNSRLSFQDKGIAVYIENPNGEGTIAKVVILSPDIYKSTTHNYWEGSTPREKGMSEAEYQKKRRKIENTISVLNSVELIIWMKKTILILTEVTLA